MRLILAKSRDGYLCRGPRDPMDWTGRQDKGVFRILTLASGGGKLLAGRVTAEQMPKLLGREVIPLVRPYSKNEGISLDGAAMMYPDAWLIGGPTVALAALRKGFVSTAVICTIPDVDLRGPGGVGRELVSYAPIKDVLEDAESKHLVRMHGVDVEVFTWRAR